MNVEELMRWLADTQRQVEERGVQAEYVRCDSISMDPDVRFTLESDTVIADINIWIGLQEADLHAISVATGENLWLDRVSVDDHDFDRTFSPILALF